MLRILLGLVLACFTSFSLGVARADASCDEKVFDDGTVAIAFYIGASTGIMARRFEGSSSPVGMEWGEINTNSFGEPFHPWPDTSYDPIEISIWEEDPGTNMPIYPPIWTTIVTPSDSPPAVRVYPPDTILSGTSIIFLGMRNPLAPDWAEGLNADGERDFGGTLISSNGGLTWEDYEVYGDWHIRACLIYPQGTEEGLGLWSLACRLWPAVPNPFRANVSLRYSVPPGGSEVRVVVYDLSGRILQTLVYEYAEAGSHLARWNGRDKSGDPVPSGIYLCRMQAGTYTATEKVVLVR